MGIRTVARAFVSGAFVGAVAGAAYRIGDAIVRIPSQIGKVIGSKASEIVTYGEAAGIAGNVAGTALASKRIIAAALCAAAMSELSYRLARTL